MKINEDGSYDQDLEYAFLKTSREIAQNLLEIECNQRNFEIILGQIITDYSKLAGFNRDEVVSHLILFECDKVVEEK